MRITRGNWLLSIYRWHSVNLVPDASSMSICDDMANICARSLWICFLGVVLVIQWPSKQFRFVRTWLKLRGPAWSRRRRAWYRLDG